MKKIRLLTLFLCLSACNSPRLYTHFPAAYWTADNQLKIQLSHVGQISYYQVKRDGTDLKTISPKDYDRPDPTYDSADGKYSFKIENLDTPAITQANAIGFKLSIQDTQSKQSRALPDLIVQSANFYGWSPDSQYFLMEVYPALTANGDSPREFWTVRASDMQIFKFKEESFKDSTPKYMNSATWNQDSQLLFLLSNGNESETNFELWRSKADATSSEQVKVLRGQAGKRSLEFNSFSPDESQMILYNSTNNLYFADLNTGKLKFLTGGIGGDWSPDGSQFAFQAIPPYDDPKFSGYADPKRPLGDIMLYDWKQDQLKSVTQTPALHEQAPQWSPDGLSLAYTVSGNKNEAGVFVSKPDGSNQVKVSQTIVLVDKAEPPVN